MYIVPLYFSMLKSQFLIILKTLSLVVKNDLVQKLKKACKIKYLMSINVCCRVSANSYFQLVLGFLKITFQYNMFALCFTNSTKYFVVNL